MTYAAAKRTPSGIFARQAARAIGIRTRGFRSCARIESALADSGLAHKIRPVLLYDAGCRLCRFAARTVVRLDRRGELAMLPLDDPEAALYLASLPEEERFSSWRLARPDGFLAGYGSGVIDLLAAMRATRPAARLLAFVPAPALDAVYRLVASRRSVLGRIVPKGPAPRRFP